MPIEAFCKGKYDQIRELQNYKDNLVFRAKKMRDTAITLGSKEIFLKIWNSFRDNSGSLFVHFYCKALSRVAY